MKKNRQVLFNKMPYSKITGGKKSFSVIVFFMQLLENKTPFSFGGRSLIVDGEGKGLFKRKVKKESTLILGDLFICFLMQIVYSALF